MELFFSDEEIENLKLDPEEEIIKYLDRVIIHYESISDKDEELMVLLQTWYILSDAFEYKLFNNKYNLPEINLEESIEDGSAILKIYHYLKDIKGQLEKDRDINNKLNILRRVQAGMGKSGSCYEFSQDEIENIQKIINDLRDKITKSKILDSDHKVRLLKKLEKMQGEIHKKMSDVDRVWGFIGSLGVVAGRFGNDIKPIVDRCRELASIIYKAEATTAQIPYENVPENIMLGLEKKEK